MSALLIRLAAPMQSWGSRSRFRDRDTEREPTKSGVIGLICAALGKPRDEKPEHEKQWPSLDAMSKLRMAVRIDREGQVLRDYQTVGCGRWLGEVYARRPITSNRFYLADAVFLVALEGDQPLLERIDAALRNPVWPIFLGRKAFPPAEPVWLDGGILPDSGLQDALRSWPWLPQSQARNTRIRANTPPERLRMVIEVPYAEDGEPRQDVPISFALGARRHGVRKVRQEWITLSELPQEAPSCA